MYISVYLPTYASHEHQLCLDPIFPVIKKQKTKKNIPQSYFGQFSFSAALNCHFIGQFHRSSLYSTWPDQCSLWLQNSDSTTSKTSFFRTEPDLILSGHTMYPAYHGPVIVRMTVAVHYLQDPCLTSIQYGNHIYNFSVPGTRIILCFYRLSISSLVYGISTFFKLFNVELSIYYQGQTSFWAI